MTPNQNPTCRLYAFGNAGQLLQAMRVVMNAGYAFVYCANKNAICVKTRVNYKCREMEIGFKEAGCRTERHYDD